VGSGYWYLVRAADCAGRPGTYNDGTQLGSRHAGISVCP